MAAPLSCFRARAPCLPGAANPPALRRLQRAQVVTRAAAPRRAERVGRSELPIFPLNLVPFPGAEVPLRIFEARYRVLFNTLLSGAEGLEEDLINEESPYKGARTFGMNFARGAGMAVTGTALHIEEHSRLPDGQMLINSRGGQRYRVVSVIKERPVLVCEVEWLSDEKDVQTEDDDFTLPELAAELRTLFVNTLRLNNKSKGDEREAPELAAELEELDAGELSFWLLRVFNEHPEEQQLLLDMTSCRKRLERARTVLRETLSYLSATSMLKAAMADIEQDKESAERAREDPEGDKSS